jgi:uncharacterized protein (TIGR03437 family)
MCSSPLGSFVGALLAAAGALGGANGPYIIDTIAGSDWVGDGGVATRALLLQAEGIAADMNGNVFVADAAGHRVRKISAAGIITTVAGTGVRGLAGDGGPATSAQINSPYGLALDSRGNLYIADLGNARVRRVAANGTITTIAGGGSIPAGGVNEGSIATALALAAPRNVAVDPGGDLYISDFNAHRVYRLSANGALTTAAGTGVAGFLGDGGAGQLARIAFPTALAVDRDGALYIADSGNHLIRKVTRGVISSLAKTGTPTGLAIDGAGALYVADRSAGQIFRIPLVGAVTALAAFGRDVAFGADGYVYAPDGDVVRRVSLAGAVSVIAGGASLGAGDGGDAKVARLNHPAGVAADAAGNVYIADRDNHRIRRVSREGIITTLRATDGLLNSPSAVSVDPLGNLVVTDTGNRRILIVTPDGAISGVVNVGLNAPVYAVADRSGNVYVADSGLGRILKAIPGRVPTVLLEGVASPRGLALDLEGNLYFTETDAGRVHRLSITGEVTTFGDGSWSIPRGVSVDAAGNVFVADTGLQRILRIDRDGTVTPVAGNGTPGFSGDGGAALNAQLGFPWDVAIAADGALLIADLDSNRIRRLTPSAVAPPAIRAIEVLNAASLLPGPIAPGMLIALRGTGLSSAEGVEVLFDQIAAPILSTSATQLVIQAPAAIATQQSVQIDARSAGSSIGGVTVNVVPAAPALFADSIGQAAATNVDGALNSASNPAPRGSIVTLYGTGEGVGGLPVSVTIGGFGAEVLYAGPAAGYLGLLQLNVRVPSGYFAGGALPVSLIIGQAASQPGVTIAVQ